MSDHALALLAGLPVEEDTTFALFVRHAHRAPIPPHEPYADVPITDQGWSAARRLAEALRGRVAWTAVSPFRRCRETASPLMLPLEEDTRLGHPGAWIADREVAAERFRVLGTKGVVRAQIRGAPVPGVRPSAEAVPLLLRAATDRLDRGSGVCVTHDAVLMPAIAHLAGESFQGAWLDPLDGFLLVRRAGRLTWRWRDAAGEVSL